MDVLITHDSYLVIKALRDSLRNIAAPLADGPVISVPGLLKVTL